MAATWQVWAEKNVDEMQSYRYIAEELMFPLPAPVASSQSHFAALRTAAKAELDLGNRISL
jgi:hypothetical protein